MRQARFQTVADRGETWKPHRAVSTVSKMDEQADTAEIWFERIGPTLGWFGTYNPTTMRGVYVLMAHMAVILLWLVPFAALAHFGVIAGPVALGLVIPVVLACCLSLMRTAHRHSAPWALGKRRGRG